MKVLAQAQLPLSGCFLCSALFVFTCLSSPGFAQPATPAALDTALQSATLGSVVAMEDAYPYYTYNQTPNNLTLGAGNLIYSDDPETVSGYGILYSDVVTAGSTRLYLYHVNGNTPSAKVTAVVENMGASTANVTFTRKSLPAPTGNYVLAGKQGVQLFYENTSLPAPLVIAPGARAVLDPVLDSTAVAKNQLVNATYEVVSDQSLRFTTLLLSSSANTLGVFAAQTVLPGDTFNRQGTFLSYTKENVTPYSWTSANGMRLFKIGNPLAAYDPDIAGYDAERSAATQLRGSYAVTYKIRVNVSSSNGKRLAVLLNPRGGAYAGYIRTSLAGGPSTGQLLPSPTLNMGDNTKAIVCAKMPLSATPQTLLIELIPAGASSLPFELILTPYSAPAHVGEWTLY